MSRSTTPSRFAVARPRRERHLRVAAAALFVVATIAVPSFAVVTDDVARMGSHRSYGPLYSGFWRTDAPDYAILTNSTHTFVNAPSEDGTIYFRGGNRGPGPDNDGWTSRMYLTPTALNVNVPVGVSLGSDSSVTALYGYSHHGTSVFGESSDGVAVYGKSDTAYGLRGVSSKSSGVIGTSDRSFGVDGVSTDSYGVSGRSSSSYGVYGYSLSSTSYAVYADGNLYANGAAIKPGGGSWAAPSDARIKTEVADFRDGLADIEKVRPVRFKYNGLGGVPSDGKEYVGVVAQDLEKALPWMVTKRRDKLRPGDAADTDLKQVDPSAFTYLLINAVKELAAENRNLKELVCADHPRAAACSNQEGRKKGRTVASANGR